jgi:hypothetical protein
MCTVLAIQLTLVTLYLTNGDGTKAESRGPLYAISALELKQCCTYYTGLWLVAWLLRHLLFVQTSLRNLLLAVLFSALLRSMYRPHVFLYWAVMIRRAARYLLLLVLFCAALYLFYHVLCYVAPLLGTSSVLFSSAAGAPPLSPAFSSPPPPTRSSPPTDPPPALSAAAPSLLQETPPPTAESASAQRPTAHTTAGAPDTHLRSAASDGTPAQRRRVAMCRRSCEQLYTRLELSADETFASLVAKLSARLGISMGTPLRLVDHGEVVICDDEDVSLLENGARLEVWLPSPTDSTEDDHTRYSGTALTPVDTCEPPPALVL